MGPVPEPVPPIDISEQEMPQHPPIVIESDDDDDDLSDDQMASYPAGYIPIQQHIDIQWLSDSEDNESLDNTSASLENDQNEQDSASLDENEVIDYSNVSSLMAAFQAHGPNVVEDQWGLDNAFQQETSRSDEIESTSEVESQSNLTQALRKIRMKAVMSSNQEELDYKDADSGASKFNSSPLGDEKEEAVKKAMQGFLLPPSAIPPWAENLKDDDISALLKEKLKT